MVLALPKAAAKGPEHIQDTFCTQVQYLELEAVNNITAVVQRTASGVQTHLPGLGWNPGPASQSMNAAH